jgi:hypothetical protein
LGLGVGNTPQVTIASGGAVTLTGALNGTSGVFSGSLGINGSPGTAFPLESYINSSTAHTTSSRGNVFRVYNSNSGANIFAGIELGGAGTANDGLAGINAVVTGSGSAALSFYTRDSNTFLERFRIASTGAATFSSSVTTGGRVHLIAGNNTASVRLQNNAANKVWELNPSNPDVSNSGFTIWNVTDNTKPFHITDSGNVGIGTASPPEKLSVVTSTNYAAAFNTSSIANTTTRISIGGLTTSGGGVAGTAAIGCAHWHEGTSESALTFYTYGGGSLTERMRITSGGNVLIGTETDSGDRLRVNGNTYTNTIRTLKPDSDNKSVEWKFGEASELSITANKRIRVSVNGVEYWLAAAEV